MQDMKLLHILVALLCYVSARMFNSLISMNCFDELFCICIITWQTQTIQKKIISPNVQNQHNVLHQTKLQRCEHHPVTLHQVNNYFMPSIFVSSIFSRPAFIISIADRAPVLTFRRLCSSSSLIVHQRRRHLIINIIIYSVRNSNRNGK